MSKFQTTSQVCAGCGDQFAQTSGGRRASRCGVCRTEMHQFRLHGSGRYASNLKLRSAIRHGHVKPAIEFKCVDCGVPAQCYDHRDYNHPLSVEPVCFTCNVRRGSAISLRRDVIATATANASVNEACNSSVVSRNESV